jgi:hypothetical protein
VCRTSGSKEGARSTTRWGRITRCCASTPTARVDGIVAAAAQRGLPLAVLDVRSPEASQLYRHRLVLVRPDQHVAWRGDAQPVDTLGLVDLVRGAAVSSVAKSA